LSVIIATISVTSGVDKGIRVLSELNVALALGLILFVLFMGDTSFLLNALVLNVGDYVNRFMGMTLNSFAFDRPVEWMNNSSSGHGGWHGRRLSACSWRVSRVGVPFASSCWAR
jgi:choline/glycine/proline betaine transport protein